MRVVGVRYCGGPIVVEREERTRRAEWEGFGVVITSRGPRGGWLSIDRLGRSALGAQGVK